MTDTNLAICIAGMHRSGTSMVAKLLQDCGLYLGPEEELGFDVSDGELHWENIRFVALNDRILDRLGGSWNNPPEFLPGWEHSREAEGLTSEAKRLIKRFRVHHVWGWKDPRNSLTLPFWRRLLPDVRVIVCLRNPLEVSQSLRVRGDLIGLSVFQLWLTYYRELLSTTRRQQRVVTHYQTYAQDPTAELRRVTIELGMNVSLEVIKAACAYISEDRRHHRHTNSDLAAINAPSEVVALYRELCEEAGLICND